MAESATPSEKEALPCFDLTGKLAKFMDRHLAYQIILFLERNQVYDERNVLEVKSEVLSKTRMVNPQIETYKSLLGVEEVPSELAGRTDQILADHEALMKDAESLLVVLDDDEAVARLAGSGEAKPESLEALFLLARFRFDCGAYPDSITLLSRYIELLPPAEREKLELRARWGMLAANILVQRWDDAKLIMTRITDLIERPVSFVDRLEQNQQRCWLIHWGLFVFFNHPEGLEQLSQMLFNERYLNTIMVSCPHLLRYLVACVIVHKRRRPLLRLLLDVLEVEGVTVEPDPIVEVVINLYVNFDFDAALTSLRACEAVLVSDFFLHALRDEFVENARSMLFETYIRIHSCLDLELLAKQLDMTSDAAEAWVVNLIRNTKLDAKIDSETNQLFINLPTPTVYKQVLDKTRSGALKASQIVITLDQLERDVR